MPITTTNITEDEDNYPVNVREVINGCPAAEPEIRHCAQDVADRTAYLKKRHDLLDIEVAELKQKAFVRYEFTTLADGAILVSDSQTLTAGFSFASNQLQVPEAGVYLVHLAISAIVSGAAHMSFECRLSDATQGLFARAQHADAVANCVAAVGVFTIATPATQKIEIYNRSGVPVSSYPAASKAGGLSVQRMG